MNEELYQEEEISTNSRSSNFIDRKNQEKESKNGFFKQMKKLFWGLVQAFIFFSLYYWVSAVARKFVDSNVSFSNFSDNQFHFKEVKNSESEVPNTKFLEDFLFNSKSRKSIEENLSFDEAVSRFKVKKAKENKKSIENMIFYGPPGTGKSYAAKVIAENYSCGYFQVSGGFFQRIYVGSGAAKLEDLIKEARKIEIKKKPLTLKPVFIIFDEIDSLALKKGSLSNDSTLTNTFLTELERIEKDNLNIVLIGTTNVIGLMEHASIREGRFSCKVEFPYPKNNDEIVKVCDSAINYLKDELNIAIFDSENGEKPTKDSDVNYIYISSDFSKELGNMIFREDNFKSIEDKSYQVRVPLISSLIKNLITRKARALDENKKFLIVEAIDAELIVNSYESSQLESNIPSIDFTTT